MPVIEVINNAPEKPMVSVCVQTYEHAPFIRACLEGILMQKVDFKYEILLGEDASTDGTRDICKEYAERYPENIRLFLHHRENNIKINGTPTGRFNLLYNLYSAKGKYIALCEGDDYWTDSYKLQKQVDFLEGNENVFIHYHNCFDLIDNKLIKKDLRDSYFFDFRDSLLHKNGYTLSMLFRKDKMHLGLFMNISENAMYGDWILELTILHNGGKGYYTDESMGVYRHHAGGITKANPTNAKEVTNIRFNTAKKIYRKTKFVRATVNFIGMAYIRKALLAYKESKFKHFLFLVVGITIIIASLYRPRPKRHIIGASTLQNYIGILAMNLGKRNPFKA